MISLSDTIQLKSSFKIIKLILNSLISFKDQYNKRFNFTKLLSQMNLSNSVSKDILSLIFDFQALFSDTFGDYFLFEKHVNGNIYLIARKKTNKFVQIIEVEIKDNEAKLLSDFIYTFQQVRKGQGLNLDIHPSKFSKDLLILKKKHPYFFIENSHNNNNNNLIYPSEIGAELGNLILSHYKNKKKIKTLIIKNYNFIFVS